MLLLFSDLPAFLPSSRTRRTSREDVYEKNAELQTDVAVSSQNWIESLLPCLPIRSDQRSTGRKKKTISPANRERTTSSSSVSSSDSDETKSLLSIEKLVTQEKNAALSRYKQLKKQVDYLRDKIKKRRDKRKTFAEGKCCKIFYRGLMVLYCAGIRFPFIFLCENWERKG